MRLQSEMNCAKRRAARAHTIIDELLLSFTNRRNDTESTHFEHLTHIFSFHSRAISYDDVVYRVSSKECRSRSIWYLNLWWISTDAVYRLAKFSNPFHICTTSKGGPLSRNAMTWHDNWLRRTILPFATSQLPHRCTHPISLLRWNRFRSHTEKSVWILKSKCRRAQHRNEISIYKWIWLHKIAVGRLQSVSICISLNSLWQLLMHIAQYPSTSLMSVLLPLIYCCYQIMFNAFSSLLLFFRSRIIFVFPSLSPSLTGERRKPPNSTHLLGRYDCSA